MRWILVLLLLSACHSRYIDYAAGQGPQGGPGYKPSNPGSDDGVYGGSSYSYLIADHYGQPNVVWPFVIYRSDKNGSSSWSYQGSFETGKILSWDGLESYGSFKCLDDVAAATCRRVEFSMPFSEFKLGSSESSPVVWREEHSGVCELRAKFKDETEQVWATGLMTTTTLMSSPQSMFTVMYEERIAELDTAAELAPKNNTNQIFYFEPIGYRPMGAIKFRVPTRLADGTVVSYAGDPYRSTLKEDTDGHVRGELAFTKPDNTAVPATVDFSCAP